MLPAAKALQPELVALRRAIHRYPELAFNEHRTAALVAHTLNEIGLETQTGVGRTGVVAYLGDGPGPVVAIRADMDALPIEEINTTEYASEAPGRMHACGHDAHTAMLLGVARLLAGQQLPGQVRLLFQPAEEAADEFGVSGAPRMLEDGALEGVDYVLALHVAPSLATGTISCLPGQASGAVDTFRAHVKGVGGHGAHPDQTVDAIWLTAQVLNALYAVPSRRIDPLRPAVLSLGVVRGGTASNVIPAMVYLEGTLRSLDATVREQLIEEVQRSLEIARTLGGDYTLDIERGYPSMVNNADVAATIANAAEDLLGSAAVVEAHGTMGAEDFAYMSALKPGAMFSLGVRAPGAPIRPVHTPDFDLDEDALPIGAAVLAETALRLLQQGTAA